MEYTEMVKRLSKPGEDILASLTPEKAHLWHMATGVAGEAFELYIAVNSLDRDNILEELGDMLFFITGISEALDLDTTNENFFILSLNDILLIAEPLVDNIKKHVVYGKDLNRESLAQDIRDMLSTISSYATAFGFTMDEVAAHNYSKLMGKRYPNGYSDEAAISRDDKIE